MDKAKLQAVFDRVWTGAEKQGWRKASNGLTCVFTAKNGDHCHVGHLLVTPELQDLAAKADEDGEMTDSHDVRCAVRTHWGISVAHLERLQEIHDESDDPVDMKARTIAFGRAALLTIPGESNG